MDEIQNELLTELNEPEFRHAYASEFIDMILARQIRALRKQRNWTQQQLAERIQKHQSFISALEDEEYGSMTLSTLKELAESFDVYLSVRFKSFRNLIEQVSHSSMKDLEVPSFEEDPVLQSPVRDERTIAGTKPGRGSITRLGLTGRGFGTGTSQAIADRPNPGHTTRTIAKKSTRARRGGPGRAKRK